VSQLLGAKREKREVGSGLSRRWRIMEAVASYDSDVEAVGSSEKNRSALNRIPKQSR
jgi:hypothetical protein